MIVEIAKHITITTVVENMVIGKIEDVVFGTKATMSNGRLPWDGSYIKADVIYEILEGAYRVTISNMMYKVHGLDDSYSNVFGVIYNRHGELRGRGDGDLRYFDNAFCDNYLI